MDAPAKQQIAERVKQATNILVTVSNNPSVDQLSACIGLTLLLNKMGKHATAVFSGVVPSTLEFLQPEKTLETNTDSLRDFIISLDKSKADKLRYKVEDQVVRIFITPYKTSLSEKDLIFSEGDFNVEVVMALGVKDRAHIDAAITAHGRILHDATVISVNSGSGNAPDIGQINWQDPTASSLCEMLVSISEAFGSNLIDNQMATAFLTGIVAETERFSNPRTSPKVMTMSAQLMAAGANQQLIVSKLEPPPPPPPPPPKPAPPPKKPEALPVKKKEEAKDKNGTLSVSHEPAKSDSPEVEIGPNEIHIDEQGNLKTSQEIKAELEKRKKPEGPKDLPVIEKVPVEPPPPPTPEPPLPPLPPPPPPPPAIITHPANFMPPQPVAAMPQSMPEDMPGPHSLLSPLDHKPSMSAPFTANTSDGSGEWQNPYNNVTIDPLTNTALSNQDGILGHDNPPQPPSHQPQPLSTLENQGAQSIQNTSVPPASVNTGGSDDLSVDSARSAVENALATQPFDPAFNPETRFGATDLNLSLHTPPTPQAVPSPAPTATPSLNLPSNGVPPPPAAPVTVAPPTPSFPPPPTPPPLTPAQGVVIPNPYSANSQAGLPPNQ